MIPFVTFDSEALAFLQAAVDRAWGALPLDRRTPVTKERIAKAVMRSAGFRVNAIPFDWMLSRRLPSSPSQPMRMI